MADHRSLSSDETRIQAEESRAFLAGILATGLAAALGAVLISYFGVQGTVTGAMVEAKVVSLLSQIVRWPLDRLERWLVRHSLLVVRRRQTVAARAQAVRVEAARRALRTPRVGWRVLVIGGVGFMIGMAAISGFELVQGKPLSATTAHPGQGQAQTGTTVGNLVHASRPDAELSADEPTPAEATEPVVGAPSPARPTTQVTRTLTPAAVSSTPTLSAQATQPSAPVRPTEAAATSHALTPTVVGPATPGARQQTPLPGPTQAPTTRTSPLPRTTAPPASPPPPTSSPLGTP